jgi:hypothetical protein
MARKVRIRLYCYDFIQAGLPNECCSSCHEDDDLGYDMIFLEPEGRSNVDAYICCGMSCAIDESSEPLRVLFARALFARRGEE